MYALQSFSTISSLQVKNWCCLKTKNLFGMHMLFIIQVSGSESSYQTNPNLHLKGQDAMKNGIRLVNHLNSIFNWKWHKMYLVVFNFEGDVSNTCQKKCWDRSKGPIADNMTVSLSEGATVRHLQLCDRRQVIQVNKLFLRITEIFRNFIFFHLVQNITKNIQRIQRRVCTQERQLKILNGHYLLAVGWHWIKNSPNYVVEITAPAQDL